MEIKQHYYISLERIPERRWAWMGIHQAFHFDFSKLTFYYAVDRLQYPTAKELFQFRINHGHEFIKEYMDSHWAKKLLKNAFFHYTASFMMVFDIISRQKENGWYVVWEEDCALNILYSGLLDLCKTAAPPNAEILFFGNPGILRALGPIRDVAPRFAEREIAHGYPHFYIGQQGVGSAKCTAVTPSGACQILEIEKTCFPMMYESLVYQKGHEFENTYTVNFQVTQGVSCTPIKSAVIETESPDLITRKPFINQILDHTGEIKSDDELSHPQTL